MLSLEDCIALCGLTEEEVLGIAHHERLNEMAAAELGNYLVRTPEGQVGIKRMLLDDIREARAAGRLDRALALALVVRNFIAQHPAANERNRPR